MSRDRRATGVPTRCLEDNPNSKTIRLAGRYISLAKLENEYGLDHGYVSYILQGKRTPTLTYAKSIAVGLGILDNDGKPDVNGLIAAIEERKGEIDAAFRNKMSA
jgi:transcriptional regulator with XRE-family HTH domain